jgi:succinate dehydrogenase / fumarate reductase, membrane anchor subunit
MADNRPDPRVTMRTTLSRVKGLGAAHHGVEHWWLHRVTAVSNVPLVIAFVIIVASLAGRPYPDVIRVVSNPFVALLLILCFVSVTNHMRLGVQIVIEDYVHEKGLKIVAVIANNFFAALIAAATIFSVLKISFGRVPLPPV